jgi:transcription elongation factor Elf1
MLKLLRRIFKDTRCNHKWIEHHTEDIGNDVEVDYYMCSKCYKVMEVTVNEG